MTGINSNKVQISGHCRIRLESFFNNSATILMYKKHRRYCCGATLLPRLRPFLLGFAYKCFMKPQPLLFIFRHLFSRTTTERTSHSDHSDFIFNPNWLHKRLMNFLVVVTCSPNCKQKLRPGPKLPPDTCLMYDFHYRGMLEFIKTL